MGRCFQVCTLVVALVLSSCATRRDIVGSAPDDLGFLASGVGRDEVERRLGSPMRTNPAKAGEEVAQYTYSRGMRRPDEATQTRMVMVHTAANALTLGLFALVGEAAACTEVWMLGAINITYSVETRKVLRVCKTSYRRDSNCYRAKYDTSRTIFEAKIPPATDDLPLC
jgi:hypothetical protein